MNIQLLREVQAAILGAPETCALGMVACGTQYCLAGHTILLRHPDAVFSDGGGYRVRVDGRYNTSIFVAAQLLELETEAQADELFLDCIGATWLYVHSTPEYAEAASRYIDEFIAKHAPEPVAELVER